MTDNPRLLIQDVHTDRDRIIDCQLIGMEVLVWEKVPSVPGSLFVAFLSSETTFTWEAFAGVLVVAVYTGAFVQAGLCVTFIYVNLTVKS